LTRGFSPVKNTQKCFFSLEIEKRGFGPLELLNKVVNHSYKKIKHPYQDMFL
jgi:hypothetical protein